VIEAEYARAFESMIGHHGFTERWAADRDVVVAQHCH
jgi:hypothetical protein